MASKTVTLALVLLASPHAFGQDTRSALERDPAGWADLLPGKNLEGWKRVPLDPDTKLADRNPWSVRGDVLRCDGEGIKEAFYNDKTFADGIFHVEWRFEKVTGKKQDYNSGVYVRS